MNSWDSKREYTAEEKQQLLINLDIEVAHRTNQFKAWLADALENFTIHQEGHVLRIPKQVRGMTMREFGAKYNGNVQAALRGVQTERLVAAGMEPGFGIDTDKSTRKRKWLASQESMENVASSSKVEGAKADAESSRATKNARMAPSTPQKAGSSTGPGTAQRSRLLSTTNKTPGTSRIMSRIPPSPSPQKPKARPPFVTSAFGRAPSSRPTSPVKVPKPPPTTHARMPSSSTFNPSLPPQSRGPAYPGMPARLPRRDESMLSANGSPIANPYDLGLGFFRQPSGPSTSNGNGEKSLRRSNSILVRRDTSLTSGSSLHSRATSQASLFESTRDSTHSRTSSEATQDDTQLYDKHVAQSQPDPATHLATFTTPKPLRAHSVMAIPTKDGHLLEFDPLQTSPGSFDALEGITDSAKKHAKEEMVQLMQAAMNKWQIR
ncbi:hypothetical protein HGRIS_005742 [Hohenbuehelia grisea]|uniref:Borealin N-terminal domain-containing protein n=1 Tax=Hohenbuehelia grisea TaxID=104357 RepID=A0ABR3K022_9AGAR